MMEAWSRGVEQVSRVEGPRYPPGGASVDMVSDCFSSYDTCCRTTDACPTMARTLARCARAGIPNAPLSTPRRTRWVMIARSTLMGMEHAHHSPNKGDSAAAFARLLVGRVWASTIGRRKGVPAPNAAVAAVLSFGRKWALKAQSSVRLDSSGSNLGEEADFGGTRLVWTFSTGPSRDP